MKEEAIEKSIGKLFNSDLYNIAKACLKRQEKKSKKRSESKTQIKPLSGTTDLCAPPVAKTKTEET